MTSIKAILRQLEDSDSSAAHSVLDHLETVMSNGREYSTRKAVKEEARQLRDWANVVVLRLSYGGDL